MDSLFKNLKKNIFERWKLFESRLFESYAFNLFKEKYQSLNIFYQQIIKFCFVFIVFAVFAYWPFSYLLSSQKQWKKFKQKQELSMELLTMRNKISKSLFSLSQNQLKGRVRGLVERYSSEPFDLKEKRVSLSDKEILYQIHFEIRVKLLNVKQVFQLGTDLNNLVQSRLSSIVMEESPKNENHYNVNYTLSSFFSNKKTNFLKQRNQSSKTRQRNKKKRKSKWKKTKIQSVSEKNKEDIEIK